MPDPDQSQIIRAGVDALMRIQYQIGRVFAHRPKGCDTAGPPYAIVSEPEIPTALVALCHDQATAYSCLFDSGKRHSESALHTRLRSERTRLVKDVCAGLEFNELRNKGVRNALAHFDERMLKAILLNSNSPWLQDIALTHEAVFDFGQSARPRMIRVYLYFEDELVVFGETLKLVPLFAQSIAISARLTAAFGL